ncbi:hypothetical protein [Actinomadura hibisca]|uniref:hypothetical protein n=1 Tax=Actinomadura hibisca TaxID=68565 RepID=UPI0012F87E16|nr:hypothetical protein [Actinomadura hibisca]
MSTSEDLYGPLTDLYARLEESLREKDLAPVGWAPHLAALRALRPGDALSTLLFAPEELPEDAPVRLVRGGDAPGPVVRALVDGLLAKGERALVLAPTPEHVTELLTALDENGFVLEAAPEYLPKPLPIPPVKGRGEQGSNGTVEFRPPMRTGDTAEEPAAALLEDRPSAITDPLEAAEEAPAPDASPLDTQSPSLIGPGVETQAPPPVEPSLQTQALTPVEPDAGEQVPPPLEPSVETQSLSPIEPDLAEQAPPLAEPSVQTQALPPIEPSVEEQAPPAAEPSVETQNLPPVEPAPEAQVLPPVEPSPEEQAPPPAEPSVQTQALPPLEPVAEAEAVEPVPVEAPNPTGTMPLEELPADATPSPAVQAQPPQTVPDLPPVDVPPPTDADAPAAPEPAEEAVPEPLAVTPIIGAESEGTDEDTQVASAVPETDRAPETRVRRAVVRTVGNAWQEAWQNELRLLQRGMLWLEQWPRDVAAMEAFQEGRTQRETEDEATLAQLTAQVERARNDVTAAQEAIESSRQEVERLAAEEQTTAGEITEPRAEAARLHDVAETAAAEAGNLTRAADAAHQRCTALVEQTGRTQSELDAARQQEQSLTGELARAREELPRAVEEAERLVTEDADAVAEGHASYYRMVSAESALGALRQKMTLGQRLHVAAPPAEMKRLRAEVKARSREADEAANRARRTKDAAEQAAARRAGLERFISEGGAGLVAAQQAQQRLGAELEQLAVERESAAVAYRDQARLAAEAVDRATQTSATARFAQQSVRALEEKLAALRTEHEVAQSAAARAQADAETAAHHLTEAETALKDHEAAAEQRAEADRTELAALTEAEQRSREQVEQICGPDPAADPESLAVEQERAMQRIEKLSAYLAADGHTETEVLFRTAEVVCGTPVTVGSADPGDDFDALIAVGPLTDAEFLVGAVRARRWILVGDAAERPAEHPEYGEPRHALFERAAAVLPVEDLSRP